MYQSLPQFYNSAAWHKFRRELISRRTNPADGVLYDEITGEPLLLAYDIVLHHVDPLTMDNVNDVTVSLNPDNIKIVSRRTHNDLHARFGFCAERKVYYVYGPPCAGKTTYVRSVMGAGDLVADLDNVWECLTGRRYHKPPTVKANAFGLWGALLDMIRTRAGRWERAWVISGGAVRGERERMISTLGAEPIYMETAKDVCLQRLGDDPARTPAQREEWTAYIERWFDEYTGGDPQ